MTYKIKMVADTIFAGTRQEEDIEDSPEFENYEDAEEWLRHNPQDEDALWEWAVESVGVSGYIDIVEE